MNLEKLKKFLEAREIPLADITRGKTKQEKKLETGLLLDANIAFVEHQPEYADSFFDSAVAADKNNAVVVAGESGSGKFVY